MKQSGEPSVEEILASIKQVIARDHRGGTLDAPTRDTLAAPEPIPSPAASAQRPQSQEHEDVLDLIDAVSCEAEAESGSPLLGEDARAAMRESLAALAAISGPGAIPQIVRSGETSLEGLVRELLRPALAEWLDKNLPALVERMVAAEIARIVGKKG